MEAKMYQKLRLAINSLAKKLMTQKNGEKIQTITELTLDSDFSRGTIQNALQVLKDGKAIETESKGHLGTFICAINYQKLWEYTGIGILTGSMPLPYSKMYEGLATGMYKSARTYGLDMKIAYVSGAKTRIQLLADKRYDFIITSELTAREAIENGFPIRRCINFGERTYLSEHVLLLADGNKHGIEEGMKVGLDSNSIDMNLLTRNVCEGKEVEYVQMPYNQIVNQIKQRKIDAGIWNYDEIKEKEIPITIRHLKNNQYSKTASESVLLVHEEEPGISNFLRDVIDKENVLHYQNLVINNIVMPEY